MLPNPAVKHAMTIDVEDYFHVAAFANVIKPSEWESYPSRVVKNTDAILKLFSDRGIKATFFCLGWVAEREPSLIKAIHSAGHEIASHGYSHQFVYGQTPEVFREETKRSKEILEDICQCSVTGYRAASYSITARSTWALEILAELGFTWDSSIFPVKHDNYGMPNSPERPYKISLPSGKVITEFPLTTAKVGPLSLPAAGGGYFRQYPYALSKWLFNRASENQTKPQIFYLHPWEVDPGQPRIENASWFSKFRHYTNIDRCMGRLEKLVDDFSFSTMSDALEGVELDIELSLEQLAKAK